MKQIVQCKKCGKDFMVYKRPERGIFCSKSCAKLGSKRPDVADRCRKKIGPLNSMFGKRAISWNGGLIKSSHGYILAWNPGHARAYKSGYAYEHILVAEKKYGRPITRQEVIHHVDRNRSNNDPENLWIFANHADHRHYHKTLRDYFN